MASVKWKPEAQEAGSTASQLIHVWWWGAQAPLLNRSGGIFSSCPPWDIPPYPLQQQAGLGVGSQRGPGVRHQGEEPSSPSSAFPATGKCPSPATSGLEMQVPTSWAPLTSVQLLLSLSCQGKNTTTGVKLTLSPFFTALLQHPFLPFGFKGTGLLGQS